MVADDSPVPALPSPPALCPRPVFVDEGWPLGQCLREPGHAGLCDVYDGRPDPLPRELAPVVHVGDVLPATRHACPGCGGPRYWVAGEQQSTCGYTACVAFVAALSAAPVPR